MAEILHRLCGYCLDMKIINKGSMVVYDFGNDQTRRACDLHFEKHKRERNKKGQHVSYGFFEESDEFKSRIGGNLFYTRPKYDTNPRTAKQDKVGQKLESK